MKFSKTIADLAIFIACLQWVYLLTVFGYVKWGLWGGVAGLMFSAPLLPFSPFTAWLFFPADQIIWFYGLLGVFLAFMGLSAILRPNIVSDDHSRSK